MKMFIDGEFTESCSGKTFEVRNPATGEVIDSVPSGCPEDVGRAADAAHEAFGPWSKVTPRERGKILYRAAQTVRQRSKDLAVLLTSEQGKPYREARDEILGFANVLEYFTGISAGIRSGFVPMGTDKYGMVIKRPIGVVGAIIPWNVPAILMSWKVGPALVTGNTMILKPASSTPLTNITLASILNESGLPKGVLNVVTGPGETVGDAILTNPKVKKISFTGETDTGKHAMEVASKSLKRVTLELGGSDPMIVCDDADIDLAVQGAVKGRFYNCGQACTAVKRLFVFESVYDEYVKKLEARVRALKVGNGMEDGIDIGPLNNRKQRESIISIIDTVKEKGEGAIIAGGDVPRGEKYDKGFFYLPTLIKDVPQGSALLSQEVFGPVLPVMPVRDLDEAIERANDTRYGLGSSIWTRDMSRATEAFMRIESGITWVNQHTKVPPELPFGGIKDSGLGREVGLESIDYYTEAKTVLVNLEK